MATRLRTHRDTFKWDTLQGSPEALRWNMRDLTSVDAVLGLVPGRTACVQAGGNLGVFGKYLARYFQSVYVFEPAHDLFPKMVANAPEPNIVRFQAALGDTPGLVGTACSRRVSKPGPVHEGLTHIDGTGIIPALRLDALALPVLDLVYLDLEGYEWYALRGAVETIERCRPVIVVELNQQASFYGIDPADVRVFIIACGYRSALTVHSDEVFVPC